MISKSLLKKEKLSVRDLKNINLSNGSHPNRRDGLCVMEAAAWLAGREHSDSPVCVSPVIASFLRSWNDSLPSDEVRNRLLRPLLPVILATVSDPETEKRRSWMAIDWLARTMTPAFMALSPPLKGHAAILRSLGELTETSWAGVRETVAAAGDAAWAAAGAAAGDAARAAAGDAAREKLAPVVKRLQKSAQELIRRMVQVSA